jgi:pimeloyl-ACP methyl ester carboxylesterase
VGGARAVLTRQPLARLLAGWIGCFVLLVLALPLAERLDAATTAARFLVEFLSEGRHAYLSASRRTPAREPIVLTGGATALVWRPASRATHPGLLLVHGLTPDGKDDPRLLWVAGLLARAGFVVSVPELPALRAQRLKPTDAAVVASALADLAGRPDTRDRPITVLAVSVGAGPALTAVADQGRQLRVRRVVALGGYAEARELVRYFTTGAYAYRGAKGRVTMNPGLVRAFAMLNLDLVQDPADREAVRTALAGQPLPATAGPEARAVSAVLENRDPAQVDRLLAALPAETRALLDALSPARVVPRVDARLLLIHGRDDPAVPYTESIRLAAAADPARTRLVLVDLIAHVEGLTPAWRQARDLLELGTAAYELFRT